MVYKPKKKSVAISLVKARDAEKREPLSRKEEVKVYKEGFSFAEQLRQLLVPSSRPKSRGKK